MISFGQILKRLREEKGITQKDLGKIAGVSDRTIGYYETDNRFPTDSEILKKLSDYFDVTIDYLLGKTDNPTTVLKFDIPKELKDIGIKYLIVAKYMQDKQIPPEDAQKIIDVINAYKKASL